MQWQLERVAPPRDGRSASLTVVLATLGLLVLAACQPPGTAFREEREQEAESSNEARQERVVVRRRRPRRPPPKRLQSYPGGKAGSSSSGGDSESALTKAWLAPNGDTGFSGPSLNTSKTLERVWSELADATGLGATEVCWLVDVSPSARAWHGDLVASIAEYYQGLAKNQPAVAKNLTTRIGIFSGSLKWLAQRPESDHARIAEYWRSLPEETGTKEQVFSAVAESLELLRDSRLKQRREVLLVIITDEAGNDGDRLLEVLPDLKKYGIPVFTLGVPAPFGRRTVTPQSAEGGSDNIPPPRKTPVIAQGPETIETERLHLLFTNTDSAFDRIDSGFGPYALEQLCSETGGRFYGIYSDGYGVDAAWPSSDAIRFDPAVMKKYRPKLQSRESYREFLAAHRCCELLVQAAKLGPIPVLSNPQTTFAKGDAPKLKNEVDRAQQAAAKVEIEINRAYDLLKQGIADRKKLTDRRWCASYDLAMGRIAAAKARVDGYNAMLAALKRGVPEKNKEATLWALNPAESTDLTSGLRSLVKQARTFLERVIEEHPGTPWEYLAKEELKTPLGWEWSEQ